MSRAGGNQLFDILHRLNTSAGAGCGAVQRGSGTGEVELAGQRPALEKSVDKSGVEDVAGAGGVQSFHLKCGGVVEPGAVPGQDALMAQSCGGKAAAVSVAHRGQRLAQVLVAGQASRNVAAGNEVVDFLQQCFYTRVEVVEVGDYGDAGIARPACGDRCGGGIVSIDVKGAGIGDPFAVGVLPAAGSIRCRASKERCALQRRRPG